MVMLLFQQLLLLTETMMKDSMFESTSDEEWLSDYSEIRYHVTRESLLLAVIYLNLLDDEFLA